MKKTYLFILISFLYIIPTFIQLSYSDDQRIKGIYFGLPMMQTGDEPHYYITLYSLVNDGDFFLTNNYNCAFYKNCFDLGKKKRSIVERHTRLFNSANKTVRSIPFVNKSLDLSLVPVENSSIKEIPGHPSGVPFFAFLFLWPMRQTAFLEHAAIYLTLLFSLFGIYALYNILIKYHENTTKATLFTLILAVGTQYWHYSKTFWSEPYLASFLIISLYLVYVKKNPFLAGILLGFGFLMKYPFALTIMPFYILAFSKKSWYGRAKYTVLLSLPLVLSITASLYWNYYFTGSLLKFNQINAVSFVIPIMGLFRWFFDPTFGLFTFSPILLFALAGVKKFWQHNKIHAITLSFIIFIYTLFWAAYVVAQEGGGGYSARYLVPLIPFFVLISSFSNVERSHKRLFYTIFVVSCVINMFAAFAYPAFYGYSILVSFEKTLTFLK